MGEPPFEAGAEKLTVACLLPATADTPVGAPGTPAVGVTEFEAVEAGPAPALLVAVTVKVYAWPLVRPPTVIGLLAPDWWRLPGVEVTVYEVMGAPPSEAGAVKLTVAWALPAVAEAPVGAPGTVAPAVPVTRNPNRSPSTHRLGELQAAASR